MSANREAGFYSIELRNHRKTIGQWFNGRWSVLNHPDKDPLSEHDIFLIGPRIPDPDALQLMEQDARKARALDWWLENPNAVIVGDVGDVYFVSLNHKPISGRHSTKIAALLEATEDAIKASGEDGAK